METSDLIVKKDFSLQYFVGFQKDFLESLKKTLGSTKTLTESAAVSCVKLCKAATYMRPEDNSVLCFLVLTILNELKVSIDIDNIILALQYLVWAWAFVRVEG